MDARPHEYGLIDGWPVWTADAFALGLAATAILIALLSLADVARPSHARAATPGLVAAYGFSETTGTTTSDASGFNNTGTLVGATRVAGKYGNGLSFNGTSNLVRVPDSTSLDATTGLTLEAWVKPTTVSGWQTLVMKESASTPIPARVVERPARVHDVRQHGHEPPEHRRS